MRSPNDKPTRAFVVSPNGRIFATHYYSAGLTSRYVDEKGRLRDRADAEGFRLLASFAKEKPGFLAAYADYCDAAERGDIVDAIPDEWLPPSITKMREKASKVWSWPAPPAKRAK